MWAIPSRLRREFEDASCAPVVAVRLGVPILRWLEVRDFAQGATDWIDVTANGQTRRITEGTDFVASGSDETTARAIANAWNANAARIADTRVRAVHRTGDRVAFVGLNPSITTMTIVTSDSGAWADTLVPNPLIFDFCSSVGRLPPALANYWPIVSDLSGLEWSLDPVTRKTTPPEVDLVFSGGREIRELLDYYSLKSLPVDLYIGTDGLTDFLDFMTLPRLYVDDVIPGPGQMTMKLVDSAGDAWRDRKITGAWVGWHPLQIALNVLQTAGARSNEHYLASSLQYDTADTSRSHFCLSRYWDTVFGLPNHIVEGKPAGELVDQLISLMSGTWRPRQTGPYEFAPFVYNAASVRTWEAGEQTGHDIDEIDEESAFQTLINRMVVSFARGEEGKFHEYVEQDQISLLEQRDQPSDFQHRTDWLNSIGQIENEFTGLPLNAKFEHGSAHVNSHEAIHADTIRFPVEYASRQGFCGTQRSGTVGGPTTLAAGMSLGAAAGRYVVLKPTVTSLAQRSDGLNETEYFLIDEWLLWQDTQDSGSVQATSPPAPPIRSQNAYACRITNDAASTVLPNGFTIGEFFGAGTEVGLRTGRGCLGTSAPSYWGGEFDDGTALDLGIVDYTIPVYMTKEVVRRFRYGAPVISHYTSLLHVDVEIGEFIALSGDDMIVSRLRGHGADSQVIWEVTGKKISIFSDQPGVEWELTYVRDDALLATPIWTPVAPVPPIIVVGQQPPADTSIFYFEDPATGMRIDVGVDGGGVYTVG